MVSLTSDVKSILYLNTRGLSLERDAAIFAAASLGLQVVLVVPDRKAFERYKLQHIIEVPFENEHDIKDQVRMYLYKHDLQISGIVAWTDREVEIVADLGEELGLLCSPRDSVRNVRNKINTRKVLQGFSNLNPRYVVCDSERTFIDGLETVGLPAVIKPAGASAGRGIFRIHSYESALKEYASFKSYCVPERDEIFKHYSEQFLLEEELRGSEHSIAGIVLDGQVSIYAIVDKKIDSKTSIQYQNTIPTRLPSEVICKLTDEVEAIIKALGINWCGFHIDFICTPYGIKVLEVGGRYGAECINSHLIPLSIEGLQPCEILLNALIGKHSLLSKNYVFAAKRRSGMHTLFPSRFGRITDIRGLERVKNHPCTKDFLQVRTIGDKTYHPCERFKTFAVAHVIVQTEIDEDIEAILEEIASFVSIDVEEEI